MNAIQKLISLTALSFTSFIFAQEKEKVEEVHNHTRPDSHAPIGVMGDHLHKKGEFMFSYRYMFMNMDGMLNGSNDISNAAISDRGYAVTPTEMTMQMHMLGAMYAPTDNITLMAMTSYKANDMDLIIIGNGTTFNTSSSGIGDSKIGALVKLVNKNNHKVHANLGLSIPTGSVNERDDIPVLQNSLLAYPMQTGTGTWDPSFGLTYTSHIGQIGWGAQTMFTFPIGDNDKGYTVGEKAEATLWGSYQAAHFVSFSTRLKFMQTGAIQGSADELVNSVTAGNGNSIILSNFMPLFSTENSGRTQLDFSIGSNVVLDDVTEGLRFGIELGLPVYQDVNGVQMKNEFMGTIGFQYAL